MPALGDSTAIIGAALSASTRPFEGAADTALVTIVIPRGTLWQAIGAPIRMNLGATRQLLLAAAYCFEDSSGLDFNSAESWNKAVPAPSIL